MVVNACNPGTQEAEARGWQVSGMPGIYSEILFQNNNNKKHSNWIVIDNIEWNKCLYK
jgi:hypothetical protein